MKVFYSVVWVVWLIMALFLPDLYVKAYEWNNSSIISFLIVFPLMVYFRDIYKRCLEYYNDSKEVKNKGQIMWESLMSLIEFITKYQWLPTKEAKEFFGWTSDDYTKWGEYLDEIGLTEKNGSNNNRRTLIIGKECQEEVIEDALTHDYYPSSNRVAYA